MKNSMFWQLLFFSGGLSVLFEDYFNMTLAPNHISSVLQGCFVVITASSPLQWVEQLHLYFRREVSVLQNYKQSQNISSLQKDFKYQFPPKYPAYGW